MGQKTLILRCIRKGPFLALWRSKGPKLYHLIPPSKNVDVLHVFQQGVTTIPSTNLSKTYHLSKAKKRAPLSRGYFYRKKYPRSGITVRLHSTRYSPCSFFSFVAPQCEQRRLPRLSHAPNECVTPGVTTVFGTVAVAFLFLIKISIGDQATECKGLAQYLTTF